MVLDIYYEWMFIVFDAIQFQVVTPLALIKVNDVDQLAGDSSIGQRTVLRMSAGA
jgi:hypothetical protein